MFRAAFLTALFLAGCGSQTTTAPRVVKMPEPTVRETVRSPNYPKMFKTGDPAKDMTFKVFNQKDQLLHLKFYPAAERLFEGRSIQVIDGHKFVQKHRGKYSEEFLTLNKLGPSTPEEFLTRYIGEDILKNPRCFLEQEQSNIWYLNVSRTAVKNKKEYLEVQHKADICGVHAADWHAPPTTFFVKDGIVIIVRSDAEAYGLDMSSITYENRG